MGAGIGAFGPYPAGSRFRVLVRAVAGSAGDYRSFSTEGAAIQFRDAARAELARAQGGERTVGAVIDLYERELRVERGNRPSSWKETPRRLRLFFADDLELPLGDLTSQRCAALYEALTRRNAHRWQGSGRARKLVDTGKPLAPDSHRNVLLEARSFLRWCRAKRWLRENPLEGIKGKGRRKHGAESKMQLRIDEARTWLDAALEQAMIEAGAVAALCALLMGMRASEITTRQVRDLDDGGRLIWIPDAKTAKGRRTLEVPAVLRPHLQRLAKGRAGDALLFGGSAMEDGRIVPHWRNWPRTWVRKVCALAKVPAVSAHAMRGLHSTLAVEAGATSHLVAASLGHESQTTTETSYIAPDSRRRAQGRRALGVLTGGVTGGVTTRGRRGR